MRDFNLKYPGLNEEQIRIKRKLWDREKETEKKLLEALKRKNPFSRDEGDDDTGDYQGMDAGGDGGASHGIVSDAALSGAHLSFVYPDGTIKTGYTNEYGGFSTPGDFKEGDIISRGGTDIVTGIKFNGEFIIDAEFFFKYKIITPLTHIANHIWNNTNTVTPDEALDLVLNHLPELLGITLNKPLDKDKVFNDDHVKLTLEDIDCAKEIQAINTMIEIHSDLIGNTEANNDGEVLEAKKKAYIGIGGILLNKINGGNKQVCLDEIFDFHKSTIDKKYKECCYDLIKKASDMIGTYLDKNNIDATSNIQAMNLAVKSEWSQNALLMTSDPDFNSNSVWDKIENKSPEALISKINITVV